MPDIPIGVEITGEALSADTIGKTYFQLQLVLDDLGRGVLGEDGSHWYAEEQVNLRVVAVPNGVSEEALRRIADEADAAFRHVQDAPEVDSAQWSPFLTERGRRAIIEILHQLQTAETITVSFSDHEPITFDRSIEVLPLQTDRPWREISSVDGILDLISVHKSPYFAIQEHGTNRRIRCIFPDEMIATVKDALGKRVIVEGMVHYSARGVPTSVTNVTSLFVRPEPTKDLEELVGSLPDLTNGDPPGEYVRKMRGRRNA